MWKTTLPNSASAMKHLATRRLCCHCVLPLGALFCVAFFIGSPFVATNYQLTLLRPTSIVHSDKPMEITCQTFNKPRGAESLPRGIISSSSDLERQELWDAPERKEKAGASKNLLAIPVGIKQKETVDQIVKKFASSNFTIMLFHYDGVVDRWRDLGWSNQAIHVSAINQTKWWFAKRFLHPDIVVDYDYIFLWDEDLVVDNFHPDRYLLIIKEEGIEISQPALDPSKSEVHHQITVRSRRKRVHRRIYKHSGRQRCYENSTSPPCTGWVEMMAPVFSRASWRCVWHMIQNDLIHAWGLDMKLGYCAQGDRTQKVGIVDAEYIIHKGIPSLGGVDEKPTNSGATKPAPEQRSSHHLCSSDPRCQIRMRSYNELNIFRRRWESSVKEDKCWNDPFAMQLPNQTVRTDSF